jgi:hypothetical protein
MIGSNENGTRLIEFAIANDLIVSSSFFPRKNINKYTRNAPNGIHKSQIDHVLVDKVHVLKILSQKEVLTVTPIIS